MFAVQPTTQSAIIAACMAPVTFLVLLAVGRWLKRSQGVKLGFSYVAFCTAAAVYLPLAFFGPDLFLPKPPAAIATPAAGSPAIKSLEAQLADLEEKLRATRAQLDKTPGVPVPAAPVPAPSVMESLAWWTGALTQHIGAFLAILSAFVLMALVRRYVWELWFEKTHHSPAPKFLSQIFSLLIFLGVVLLVVAFDYKKDLTALIFGSTVIVGIIGFAMQDLLGNIISGIALEIGKPFRTGDWLIHDGQRAEVIEVNWRSTRLRTNDDVYLDLPNKTIAGAIITNLTYPTAPHGVRIRVHFDYSVPPNFIKECVIRATAHARGVLGTPTPKVYLREFSESAAIYEVRFWIENETHFNEICDAVRTNIWYEAQRSKIPIPFPQRVVHMNPAGPGRETESLETARAALRKQPFFNCLDDEQAGKLLKNAALLRFGRGEKVIEQGDQGLSMFLVSKGEADVFVQASHSDTLVATLRAGDYFGEMSLLTGEPRSATVVARLDCEMWEIQKVVLAEILQQNQSLVEKLSELLARRRMELDGILAAQNGRGEITAKQREITAGILARLCSFFEL